MDVVNPHIYEFIINIDTPFVRGIAEKLGKKTISRRIAELQNEITVQRKLLQGYENRKLDIIRQINELSDGADYWR